MPGKIFISYRRGDSKEAAVALRNFLAAHNKNVTLFLDVEDTIPLGENFERVIRQRISESDIVLVIIGDKWLSIATEQGKRRIDLPDDLVRFEVTQALRLGVTVIPILLNDVKMPEAATLPSEMSFLIDRNASRLRLDRFNSDAKGIARSISLALRKAYPLRSALKSIAMGALVIFASGIALSPYLFRYVGVEIIGKTAANIELTRAQRQISELSEKIAAMEMSATKTRDLDTKGAPQADVAAKALASAVCKLGVEELGWNPGTTYQYRYRGEKVDMCDPCEGLTAGVSALSGVSPIAASYGIDGNGQLVPMSAVTYKSAVPKKCQ